jgi:hypothetical protein
MRSLEKEGDAKRAVRGRWGFSSHLCPLQLDPYVTEYHLVKNHRLPTNLRTRILRARLHGDRNRSSGSNRQASPDFRHELFAKLGLCARISCQHTTTHLYMNDLDCAFALQDQTAPGPD